MTDSPQAPSWADALSAAALLAVDPLGLGGVRLRAAADARRDHWMQTLQRAWPDGAPMRRMPLHIGDDQLLGGLDLGATLHRGRTTVLPGLLARCDQGLLVVAMAERLEAATAARLCAVLDTHRLVLQRDGLSAVEHARLAIVALDEGAGPDESVPAALNERLGLQVDLQGLAPPPHEGAADGLLAAVGAARARLPQVQASDEMLQALCEAAQVLGVASLRASLFALRAARASAALAGRTAVAAEDAALAARLVLSPRATRLPQPPADDPEPADPEPPTPPPAESSTEAPDGPPGDAEAPLPEQVLAAALAAIPPGLLALLAASQGGKAGSGGRAGALQASRRRGRPYGSRRGDLRGGARLHLVDTLRAAAPWQPVRRREHPGGPLVRVRRDDFHVVRHRQRRETTTVFVVDASGSAALHRLAEAKGAVELLLAECYIRRDRVALIAFRGAPDRRSGAQLLLPPTRSLVRAKRCLAELPGGGGTPLASGLDAARELAEEVLRRGGTPVVVLLTDGRANLARDGTPGRQRAGEDALAAARAWRHHDLRVLWLDIGPHPEPQARQYALEMGARYLPLPHVDARQVAQVVRAAGV